MEFVSKSKSLIPESKMLLTERYIFIFNLERVDKRNIKQQLQGSSTHEIYKVYNLEVFELKDIEFL
jgi:hypothetical protein